jgi:hypothetical protein
MLLLDLYICAAIFNRHPITARNSQRGNSFNTAKQHPRPIPSLSAAYHSCQAASTLQNCSALSVESSGLGLASLCPGADGRLQGIEISNSTENFLY